MEADITSQAVGLSSNTDFSLVSLFLRADIVVKSVMIILVAFSIYSWAIIFDKIRLLEKLIKVLKNLRKNFGNQNLQKHFIIIYRQLPMIQWLKYLKTQCKW